MKLNLNNRKKQGGFALIEVIAAAALIGILVTMLMPSLSGANARVKNAKLKNDLATVDQAIQLYVLDKGSMPSTLSQLHPDYIVNKTISRMLPTPNCPILQIIPISPIP